MEESNNGLGIGIVSQCQNYPGPDFCPNGSIVDSEADSNGCTIWECEGAESGSEIINDEVEVLDDTSSGLDLEQSSSNVSSGSSLVPSTRDEPTEET